MTKRAKSVEPATDQLALTAAVGRKPTNDKPT